MITLAKPVSLKSITSLEVRAVKFEANKEAGQQWVEVWADYGFVEAEQLRSCPIPGTSSSVLHFKFENGMHPASPGKMLGQCKKCGAWAFSTSGPCWDLECDGVLEPFSAYDQFINKIGAVTVQNLCAETERFLINDQAFGFEVPDAIDRGTVGPLVGGTV